MCSAFDIQESGQPQYRSDKLFFLNIRSRQGEHGAQTKNALPTGAGRAKNRFPAQLCSHAGNG